MTQEEKDVIYEKLDDLENLHEAFAESVYDNAYCDAIRDFKHIIGKMPTDKL